MIVTREELINVFKYIVKKCDMLINNGNYEADAYTQDTVEDIAELCNHILDGDYGKLIEVKEVDLMIHTIITECCDWLTICTDLSHDLIEGCRNLMLTVKDEQLKAQKGE